MILKERDMWNRDGDGKKMNRLIMKDIERMKRELEDRIENELIDFTNKTDLSVDRIELEQIIKTGRKSPTAYKIRLRISL